MKKLFGWWDRPITWGDSCKVSLITMGIYAVVYCVATYTALFDRVVELLTKKKEESTEYGW